MLAFEVLVNGKRLCTVGTSMSDVVSTGVTWARRASDEIRFNVGGLARDNPREHFYFATPKISVGDEVSIKLVDVDKCDEPDRIYQPTLDPEASGS